MLTINASIENEKIILDGLRDLERGAPDVLRRALSRAAIATERHAVDLLSGPASATGGYPVPVVTGNLRRLQNWLSPGESKDGMKAGNLEAIVYNSAEYAEKVHQGMHMHYKFGPRPFIKDAFDRFNGGDRLSEIATEELEKEIRTAKFS